MIIRELIAEGFATVTTERDWTEEEFKSALSAIYSVARTDLDTGCINVWTDPDAELPRSILLGKRGYSPAALVFYFYFGVWPSPRLRHLCNNPRCVNNGHLWIGDHDDCELDVVWRRIHGNYGLVPKNYFKCPDLDFRRAWQSPADYLEEMVYNQFNSGRFVVRLP